MAAHLRVYSASDEGDTLEAPAPTVRVSLADLLPLVALAHRHNYMWLQDFLDDEVAVAVLEVELGQRAARVAAEAVEQLAERLGRAALLELGLGLDSGRMLEKHADLEPVADAAARAGWPTAEEPS